MARADKDKTKSLIFEKLGISNGYGTYKANARYPEAYINNVLISVDIQISKFLLSNKQDSLMQEEFATSTITNGASLPKAWAVIKVDWDTTGSAVFDRAKEISWGDYQNMKGGDIFNIATYGGYYAIMENTLYAIPTARDFKITYIDFTHPASLTALKSPEGFEGVLSDKASAICLMKRGDQPDRSEFYNQETDRFLQIYKLPEMNNQDTVDK